MAREKNYEIEWQTISIRSIKIFLLLVVAVGGFLLYSFWFKDWISKKQPVDEPIATESAARFMDYEGKVEVKPREEFVWKSATFKMDLHEGDRIRTAPDSSARIKFEDGTEITVQPDSIVVINKRSSEASQQASLMVIEIGGSDIVADKSSSPPAVSSERIQRFQLAPGGEGSITVDQQSGQHSTTVSKGFGESTVGGKTLKMNELERVQVGRENQVTKVKLPSTPSLFSPQNGQVFDFLSDQGLTVELKWRDVPNVDRYHVQISETMLFAKLKGENTKLNRSSIAIKIPKTNKKQYFWRVRSIDKNSNASPWSSSYQFVVQTPTKDVDKGSNPDKTPPALSITYLHPFLPFVQVEGKTEPDAFLTLNGEVLDVKEDGSFVYTYTLRKSGMNDLVFLAEDPAGNKTTQTKQVEY